MRRFLQQLDARDVHTYGGTLLIALGLIWVYWPAALIVPGAILLYVALRRVT